MLAEFLFVLREPIRLPKPRFNLAGCDMSSGLRTFCAISASSAREKRALFIISPEFAKRISVPDAFFDTYRRTRFSQAHRTEREREREREFLVIHADGKLRRAFVTRVQTSAIKWLDARLAGECCEFRRAKKVADELWKSGKCGAQLQPQLRPGAFRIVFAGRFRSRNSLA